MSDPSTSPSGFHLVTSDERRKVLSLAAPRIGAWLVDAGLFALLIVVFVQLDGWVFQGAFGLNAPYEVEERLIEELDETLETGVERSTKTYEEIRTYKNGTQSVWHKIIERRVGQFNDGSPWDVEVTRYEFVSGDEGRPGRFGHYALALLVMLPLPYRYFLESSSWQGSVGMRLFGLKVTTWDLKPPSQRKILERNLWRFLSVVTVGIGYVMVLFTAHRQTLHDKLTGTLVVSDKRLAELGGA